MFRLNKHNIAAPLGVVMLLLALLACGYSLEGAQSAEKKLPPVIERDGSNKNNESPKPDAAKKPDLYGIPIVITFPNLPAVPDKIKAPKPSSEAGAALRNIPSINPTPTSDGPAAARSR